MTIRGLWLLSALCVGLSSGLAPRLGVAGTPVDPESYAALQRRIIEVSEQVTPSVVHVEAIVKVNDRRNQITGSGLVVAADGVVLTNQHVVEKAQKVTVLVPGHKGKLPAKIIGTDKQTDIAVLKIQRGGTWPAAELGSAETLAVGQWVLAVGNPYGLDGTVSLGIVSAMGRNLAIPGLLNDFIQTDAMIDRGSSGGPLVDLDGRIVGINSRGQGRGIGFTIPIDTALQVMDQLVAGGVERGWLGITLQPLDRELADYLGDRALTGVVITSISSGSPADKAGLRPGDILTDFAGQAVEAEKDEDLGRLQRRVAAIRPGENAKVVVRRDGATIERSIALEAAPKAEPDEAESDFGFHVQEITQTLYRTHRLPKQQGAFVSFVARGSPAAEAGLEKGDVVSEVEGAVVDDLQSFRGALRKVRGRERFLVVALRGDERLLLLIRPGESGVDPSALEAEAAAAR